MENLWFSKEYKWSQYIEENFLLKRKEIKKENKNIMPV